MELAAWGETTGQGWTQIGELALAFALSVAIGVERGMRQKSAGLRTHTLVGFAAALMMLVSKYGFGDVLVPGTVSLDPSRVAAQIVSGVGFLGAGLIFVRRDSVRGLTTAAGIWLTAGVGMAAGAGLPVLALLATVGYFLIVFCLAPLAARLPAAAGAPTDLYVDYLRGQGVLREVLARCTGLGFVVQEFAESRHIGRPGPPASPVPDTAGVRLTVSGRRPVTELAAELSEIGGVHRVGTLEELED